MVLSSRFTTNWHMRPQLSNDHFQALKDANIDPLLAQLLHNRGLATAAEMRRFLDAQYDQTPDPYTLIDMRKAVDRISHALTHKEHITVYGDYDADGVTSSALLFRALQTLKHPDAPLDFHIPSRLHDGCGLNIPAIDQLKARGASLIITTDCASSDNDQIAYAARLGIDVIITDHHHPPAPPPAAYAMLNPRRLDSTYSERYLCGVGVSFKLVQALYRAYQRPIEDELALLDLVAIGAVADVSTLLGENHTLVRLGLQQLNATTKPGLLALIQKANLQPGKIQERDIAYSLAPRINAAGRMKDASIAFLLLVTDDHQQAYRYAEELEQLNLSRQIQTEQLMQSVRREAQLRPADQVVLVSGENWPEGIISLVAGKLSEEIHRPVLVLSKGPQFSRGSARSSGALNLIRALQACSSLLARFGGHEQAAGFTIANERVEALRQHLLTWNELDIPTASAIVDSVHDPLQDTPSTSTSSPKQQHVDLIFTRLERLNYATYSKIRELAPFGPGNPEPIFKMDNLRILDRWQSGIEGRNLRIRLGSGSIQRKATLTRGAPQLAQFQIGQSVNIIFRLEAAWNPGGNDSKQEIWLKILDVSDFATASDTHSQ